MKAPDFPASLFSLSKLNPLLQTQGAVLLRQLLPPDQLRQWLTPFAAAYAKADEQFQTGQMDAKTYHNFYMYGHADPHDVANYREWLQSLLKHLALRNVLRTIFGPQALVLYTNSAPRRQACERPEHAIGFHQDQEFMGCLSKAINIWVPLTPVGGDYPGLELWLGSPQTALLSFEMSPEDRIAVCSKIPAEALWRPVMKPGDVLLFTHYTVHRTWLDPAMTQTRLSYELRLTTEADRQATRSALINVEL